MAAQEIHVLVVEDDLGYAVLVEEFLAESGEPIRVVVASNLDEASLIVPGDVACVLLDLGLPDAQGLEALDRILKAAPDVAVVVLTGRADRDLALRAVAAGAQDYLTKDEVDTANLARSIRYAVERKRAVESARKLLATDLVAAERDRLERGLLPRPLVHDPGLAWASRNRPAGGSLMLGGDFFDAVEMEDSRVRMVIGDVCGHGPDEAALGVALRIAWRSLVLAGVEDDAVLHHVESILKVERGATELFVTMCDLTIGADRRSMSLRVGGHPLPLLVSPHLSSLAVAKPGVPLGVLDDPEWPTTNLSLPPGWALLMYTDGLVEGRNSRGQRGWSDDGLAGAVRAASWSTANLGSLADQLIIAAEAANGGPLDDDVAVLLLAEVQD